MPEPLPTRNIHHVSLQSKDAEKTERFYREVLGFAPLKRPPFQFPGAWLFKDGLQIHLIGGQGRETEAKEISSRADHVAFHSDQLDAVEKLLGEHGIEYRVNIQSGTNLKQLFFHDPDGHTIEIATYPEPMPAEG